MVEVRTRRLLQIPKDVMVALEIGDHWPPNLRLFSVDNLRQGGFFNGFISYSVAFRSAMVAHMAFGAVFIAMAFCPDINPTSPSNKHKPPTPTLPPPTAQP